MESVLVKGVDWVQENDLHGLRQMLKAGDWSIIQARAGVIVGAELGRLLAVEVGDMIQLTAPNQTLRLPVTGLFFTGFYANDAALVITDLATAESLWGIEGLTGYAVNVADLALVDSYILPLQRATNLWVKPWYQQQPALYIGLAVQRKVIILIVLFVFLVALLGIASIFSLRLLTQQKSIGILRALGARPCHIWQIFVGQALICGGLGGMIGLAGAYLTVLYLARYPISLPQVYYMQTLPIAWAHGDVGLVLVAAIVTSVLALLYPAYRFSRILPAEVIRNG